MRLAIAVKLNIFIPLLFEIVENEKHFFISTNEVVV